MDRSTTRDHHDKYPRGFWRRKSRFPGGFHGADAFRDCSASTEPILAIPDALERENVTISEKCNENVTELGEM